MALLFLVPLFAFRLDDAPPEPVRLRVARGDSVAPLLRPPETAIAAPTRGAPLVAAPGGRIVVDLVLRLALTPPPGVQQERALNGFRGTATGYSEVGFRPTYPLRVTMIRPDGPATSYRAMLELPPWMAPGVYDLEIAGRAFSERQERALVVTRGRVGVYELEAPARATGWAVFGAVARRAVLSGAALAFVPAGIARSPAPAPPASEGRLGWNGSGAEHQARSGWSSEPGGGGITHDDEPAAAHEAFTRALDGVGLATAVRPSSADLVEGGVSFRRRVGPIRWSDDAPADAFRSVRLGHVLLEGGVTENTGDRPATVVLRVATREAAALLVDGLEVRPTAVALTGDLDAPGVLRTYEIALPPRSRSRLELASRSRNPAPVELVAPPTAAVGERVTLATTADSGAVGWSLGDDSLAAGRKVRHRFTRLGRHDLRIAIARADGSVATGSTRLHVATRVTQGCSAN